MFERLDSRLLNDRIHSVLLGDLVRILSVHDQLLADHFRQLRRTGGQTASAHQIKRLAGWVCHRAAGLHQDGRTTRVIPAVTTILEVRIASSFGHMTQVQCRRTELTEAMAFPGERT